MNKIFVFVAVLAKDYLVMGSLIKLARNEQKYFAMVVQLPATKEVNVVGD